MAIPLKDAISLAASMGLELTTDEIRRMYSANTNATRASFASPSLYEYFQILHEKVPYHEQAEATVSNPEVEIITKELPTTRMHNASLNLSSRYMVCATGLVPIATISRQQAIEDLGALIRMREQGEGLMSATGWMLGDSINIIVALQEGEPFDLSEIMDPADKTIHTLATTARVAAAFPHEDRDPELTFSHYKELFYQKGLEPEQKNRLLHLAKKRKLNTKETRALGSRIKNSANKEEALAILESSPDAIVTALHVDRKYTYYDMTADNVWKRPADQETPTLGLQLRTTSALEKFDTATSEWTPVTIQQPE